MTRRRGHSPAQRPDSFPGRCAFSENTIADTLTITKSAEGPVKVLHLAGELNGQTQAELVDAARAEHAAGTRYLLIDLTYVDHISGAGLGALHNIYKMFTPEQAVDAWGEAEHR